MIRKASRFLLLVLFISLISPGSAQTARASAGARPAAGARAAAGTRLVVFEGFYRTT